MIFFGGGHPKEVGLPSGRKRVRNTTTCIRDVKRGLGKYFLVCV